MRPNERRFAPGRGGSPEPTRRHLRGAALAALLGGVVLQTAEARAQWVERSFELHSGWNAVWVDVEPHSGDPRALLSGIDYKSLWTYLPSGGEASGGRWLSHHRNVPEFLDTLHGVKGGRAYLIDMRSASELRITGRPLDRAQRLVGGAHNLFGASVDPRNPPTVADYFAAPGVRGKIASVYAFDGTSVRELVEGSRLEPGEVYWVRPVQDLADVRPLRTRPGGGGLRFTPGSPVSELVVHVAPRPVPRLISVRAFPSARPPAGEPVDRAGADASWLEVRDPSTGEFLPLSEGARVTVEAGESTGRLRVRAAPQDPEPPGGGGGGAGAGAGEAPGGVLQAVVEVTDGDGNRALAGASLDTERLDGLWIGQLTLREVATQPALDGAPRFEPAPAVQAGLILRIPPGGEGAPQLLDRTEFTAERDGEELVYRYVAVLFHEAVSLSGSLGPRGRSGALEGVTRLGAEHPVNPYRHRYNPEHRRGYPIERAITLRFLEEDPAADQRAPEVSGLQPGGLFGTYEEEIRGLSLEPIRVRGTFRLRRLGETARVASE